MFLTNKVPRFENQCETTVKYGYYEVHLKIWGTVEKNPSISYWVKNVWVNESFSSAPLFYYNIEQLID